MKNIICIGFLFLSINSFCQKIYSVKYASQSDFKVYVVDYASQADLKVFKVDYKSQAIKNDGLWYFVKYKSQSDKNIYFIDYKVYLNKFPFQYRGKER